MNSIRSLLAMGAGAARALGAGPEIVRRWNTEVNRIMQLLKVQCRMEVEAER